MALTDENTTTQQPVETQQRPSGLQQYIAKHGTEGLNQNYVNYTLANGGGFGATAAGVVKDAEGNLHPIYNFNRSKEEIAYAKALKRGENLDTWYAKAKDESDAAAENYKALSDKLASLNAANDRMLTASPFAVATYQNAPSKEEISHLEEAIKQAEKDQQRKSDDFAAAKAYKDYRDTTRPVEEAYERGISYDDINKAYSQSLDKLNKDRAAILEELNTIRHGGKIGDEYYMPESPEKQKADEDDALARLEKVERQLERIEGLQLYAQSRITSDRGAEAVIRQGEELARTAREQGAEISDANRKAKNIADYLPNAAAGYTNFRNWVGLLSYLPEGGGKLATVAKAIGEAVRDLPEAYNPISFIAELGIRKGEDVQHQPQDNWTKEQIDLYNYFYGNKDYGPEIAKKYAQQLNYAINTGDVNNQTAAQYQAGLDANGGFLSKAGKTVGGLLGAVPDMALAAGDFQNKALDILATGDYAGHRDATSHEKFSAFNRGRVEDLNRNTLSENIPVIGGKGWGDLYQLGQSSLQSLAMGNILGEAATLGAFFVNAANSSFDEAMQRTGGNTQYASTVALLSGAAEVIGEKLSLDHLLKGGKIGSLSYILKQAGIEGSEEVATSLMNQFFDRVASTLTGEQTAIQQQISDLVRSGMSYADAEKQVWRNVVSDVAFDFVGGALSAGFSGVAQSGVNATQNKLWDMRKDSVLGKENAEGQREGGKKNASNDELSKMFDRALKRGDIRGAEQILQVIEQRSATAEEQEYGPVDPTANERMRRKLERQLNGERVSPQTENAEIVTESATNRQLAEEARVQAEFPTISPITMELVKRLDGKDFVTMAKSMTTQELAEVARYARYIGENAKADLLEQIRLNPTYRYEEQTPAHTDEDDLLQNGPQNVAGQQVAPAGQITQPIQQNAAQTVKPVDSERQGHIPTWEEYKAQNNIFLQTGMKSEKQLRADYERMLKSASTTSTESGTIPVPNTQEVTTNAGEQVVQQPEAAEAADFGVGRRPAGAGAATGQRGASENAAEAVRGRESGNAQSLPRFAQEDVNELSDVEESAPITQEQKNEYSSLIPLTNNGIQVVSKPQIGSRLHLAWSLAKKLGQKVLFARNYNGSVFKDGSTAYQSKGNAIVDADNTQMELATAVAHEAGHDKYFKKFGGYADIVNGAYTKRLNFFAGVFNNALGTMRGLQTMRTAEKYIRDERGYGKRYDRSRERYTREVNARITNPLTQNATNLVAEMEKARSVEEFMNQLLAWDESFIADFSRETGVSYDDIGVLREALINSLVSDGIFTDEEITAIDDAIDALEEGNFTDDLSDEEEENFASEAIDADAEAANFKGDINRAVRKAAAGNTSSMEDAELLAVLGYALDRAIPASKGMSIAERLSDLYDEYGKSATSYVSEAGEYFGRHVGALSEGKTDNLVRTVDAVLRELGNRNVELNGLDGDITDFANMFGAIVDRNGNPFDIAYSEKRDDTREYDNGKGILETEDEWNRKNARRIARDMERGNDVVESFNSYQENGTRRRDIPTSPAKTTQRVNSKDVVDTGWIEPVAVSEKEVKQARDAVEAKGKEAQLKDKLKTLEAQRKYLEAVAKGMHDARSKLYGSEDIEQRKADLGYIADSLNEQLEQLDADLGYVADGVIGTEEEAAIDNILSQKERANAQLDALRDEYKHIEANDSASLRNVRSQIDSVISEISALSRQLDSVSKRAEKADWGSNKRTLFQAEMAENPLPETEERESLPPINEEPRYNPRYNPRIHELSYEERAEERLRRAKDAAKKEAERRRTSDFGSELRARTDEYQIVRNETDRSLNDKSNIPGYSLNSGVPVKAGIAPTFTSENVKAITRSRVEQIKQEEQLNRSFGKAIRRVTGKDLKGFNVAREMRQGMADRYEPDVDAEAADFGEPTRGMGTGYVGMQRSRNKDGSLEFRTMYDDALPTRPATDKTRKPLNAPSTAYSNVAQAARSILNSKNSFLDFTKDRSKDIPSKVTNTMGQLREHVREMMEGDHPVNALMQLSNMVHEFENDDDLKVFSSDSIKKAADELNDIYYNQDITNEEKARRMVENATKTLTLISKRIQLVDRGYNMLKTFTGPKKKRDNTTFWSKYKAMQLNPSTLFKAMDGFARDKNGSGYQIAKMIENGTALYTITQAQALKKLSDVSGLEGFKEFAEGNAKPFDIDGVKITEQQAVEFIMQVRNLQNTSVTGKDGPTTRLNTIDGFSIKDKDGNNTFIERSDDADGTNAEWFLNLAEAMENSLSPAAKKYLETATEILDDLGQQASDIRTNLIGTGFDNSINGTYYPINYDNKNGTAESQQNKPTSLFSGPMYQSRTRNVGGYVSIKNASDTMGKYIHWASNAIGYGEVAELLYAMDNTGSRMQNLSSLANDTLGQGYSEYIAKYIKDINEIPDGQKNDKSAFAVLRRNMAAGALLGNLGVAAKQAASLWSAAGVLSPQALLSAETYFGGHSGAGNMILQSRMTGTSLDPTISEILHNDSFMGKLMKRSGVSEVMGKATAFVDYQTVKRLFAATVVDTKLSFPGLDQNSELFAQTVEAKFQDVVLQTQPIFVKNARAGYLRANDELTKAFAMFRTQPTQNLNSIVTAMGEYRALKGTEFGKAAGKKLRNTIIGQTASAVTFATLSAIVSFARHGLKKFRDDDDEISWAEVAKRIGLDSLESLAGISVVGGDIAKAIIDMATGGDTKEFYDMNAGVLTMLFDTVSSVTTFGTNVVKAIKDDKPLAIFNAGRQAADNLLQLGGIPANTVYRLLNSITMYSADALRALSGGKLGNRAEYDDALKMLDSYIKGDLTEEGAKTQAAKAFRKDQPENLLYNLGILSSLTSKDSKVDKGTDWLNTRIQGKTEAERKAYKEEELARLGRNLNAGERIANYLADSALSAAQKDEAISKFATTSGYNVLYESLRAAGMTPKAAVEELGKTDNKTGLSTDIRSDDSLADLYAGKDNPGETNDVPALDKKNTDEYVNFVSAMKVFRDTGNYSQLDKLVDQYSKLDANTRAVIDAKDSTMKRYREYRSMGLSTKDYYNVKDAIKQAQIDLDLAANTGTAVKLVGLSKANLTKAQIQKLVNSEALGISKTGKSLISVLSKYGYTIGDIGMFMYNTDWTNDDANGTLSQQEVVLALAKEKRLTDAQRSAIYEELKPLLRNEYKINHWYDKSYEYELNYLLQNGKTSGRAS